MSVGLIVMSVITAVVGGGGTILRKEIGPFCVWVAPRITRWAARRLEPRWAQTREEEWLAILDEMHGMQILRLWWAIGFCVYSIKTQPRASKQAPEAVPIANVTVRIRHRAPIDTTVRRNVVPFTLDSKDFMWGEDLSGRWGFTHSDGTPVTDEEMKHILNRYNTADHNEAI